MHKARRVRHMPLVTDNQTAEVAEPGEHTPALLKGRGTHYYSDSCGDHAVGFPWRETHGDDNRTRLLDRDAHCLTHPDRPALPPRRDAQATRSSCLKAANQSIR